MIIQVIGAPALLESLQSSHAAPRKGSDIYSRKYSVGYSMFCAKNRVAHRVSAVFLCGTPFLGSENGVPH